MNAPDVSVVIPLFDGAAFLEPTLRAVLAQQGVRLELLVVDDGSRDAGPAIVQRVAPGARLLRQPNAGVCAARNHGLREARAAAVIFLDQDDLWHPQMLARQLAVLRAEPGRVAAVCPYHHWRPLAGGAYPEPASIWGHAQAPLPPPRLDPAFSGWVYHQFLWDCWALTSATLLDTAAVRAAGGFDQGLPFSEDWELWLRLSRQGTFACLDTPPVLYRHHGVQESRRVRERDFRVELLLKTAAEHGLASRDGRAMEPARFRRLIAGYEAAFAYHHLLHGDRRLGARTMWRAWRRDPGQWKRLAQALAGWAGWRPGGRGAA